MSAGGGIGDHPLRYALANEFHARPFAALRAPCHAAILAIKAPHDAAARDPDADLALLPIENTTAGSINETYDLLYEGGIVIVGEEVSHIEHCLLVLPGTKLEQIRTVMSSDALARRWPSGLQATEVTAPSWPLSTASASGVKLRHIRPDVSAIRSQK